MAPLSGRVLHPILEYKKPSQTGAVECLAESHCCIWSQVTDKHGFFHSQFAKQFKIPRRLCIHILLCRTLFAALALHQRLPYRLLCTCCTLRPRRKAEVWLSLLCS